MNFVTYCHEGNPMIRFHREKDTQLPPWATDVRDELEPIDDLLVDYEPYQYPMMLRSVADEIAMSLLNRDSKIVPWNSKRIDALLLEAEQYIENIKTLNGH